MQVYIGTFFIISTVLIVCRLYVQFRKKNQSLEKQLDAIQKNFISNNQLQKAEKYLVEILEKHNKPLVIQSLLQVYTKQNKLSSALALVNKALLDFPKHTVLSIAKAEILKDSGLHKEALSLLESHIPNLRKDKDMLLLAELYFQENKHLKVLEVLSSIKNRKDHDLFLTLSGDSYFVLGDFKQASIFYQKAIQRGISNEQIMLRLAFCYVHLKHLKSAEILFLEVLKRDSASLLATLGLGKIYEHKHLYAKALILYLRGQAMESRTPLLHKHAGFCAIIEKHYSLGISLLRKAYSKKKPCKKILTYLSYAYYKLGNWKGFEACHLEIINTFSSNTHSYKMLAWLGAMGRNQQLTLQTCLAYARNNLQEEESIENWEILSACQARIGNYQTAHDIHEQLTKSIQDKHILKRLRHAMRSLRKKQPLSPQQLTHVEELELAS